MGQFQDLIGQKFNRLTVIEKTDNHTSSHSIIWKCQCECGNENFVSTSALKSGDIKSCGCLKIDKLKERSGKNHYLWGGPGILVKCAYCDKEFTIRKKRYVKNYRRKVTKDPRFFCSLKCSNDFKIEDYAGERSVNWRGGITKKTHKIRVSAASKNWRKSIFERDNYTCQKCGVRGGTLNAHHITNFASIYENNEDGILYDTNNGITFCQECHKEFHKKYGSRDNTKEQINEFIK